MFSTALSISWRPVCDLVHGLPGLIVGSTDTGSEASLNELIDVILNAAVDERGEILPGYAAVVLVKVVQDRPPGGVCESCLLFRVVFERSEGIVE